MNEDKEKTSYNDGHRERLKEKLVTVPEGLADYEILELLLGYSIPRKDVKPLAKELLAHFKELDMVLSADIADLVVFKGLKRNTAIFLKAIKEAHVRSLKAAIIGRPVFDSWDKIIDYCRMKIGCRKEEVFCALWLNKQLELVCDEDLCKGTTDAIILYPQEIARRGVYLRASQLIMVHNHPTGNLKPSEEDKETTRDIQHALLSVGMKLFDHLIVSRNSFYSFRDKGHMI